VWTVVNKAGERLVITVEEVPARLAHELGVDPGLVKDGVEAHLQELLAEQVETLGEGWRLVRREYPTAIGPVDLSAGTPRGIGRVEIKRRGEIDGVEQLTRYLELLNRDPCWRRCAASSPRRRSSRRPVLAGTAGSTASRSTTTPCAGTTTSTPACSEHAPRSWRGPRASTDRWTHEAIG
jgi:hypothetical protein